MLIAITRPVSPTLAACELTHLVREPIDVARATAQHESYEETLRSLGAAVVRVPAAPELPDAVFVEDTALVLDEVAVIARPGAASRRAETGPVAQTLEAYRPVLHLEAPATLDGGDVLRVGRTLFVGLSSRTNRDGLDRLRALAGPLGYQVVPVPLTGCLHLKSAVTEVADRLLLLNPHWVSPGAFAGLARVEVAPEESGGANALRLGEAVVYQDHYPRTAQRLVAEGIRVVLVDCGELAKAEGGVTCCSLVFEAAPAAA
jgi:dimethylargininase